MSKSFHETHAPRWGYDPITSGRDQGGEQGYITIDGDVTGSCWGKKRKRAPHKQTRPRALLFQEPGRIRVQAAAHSTWSDPTWIPNSIRRLILQVTGHVLVALHRKEPEEKKKSHLLSLITCVQCKSYRSVRLNVIVEDLFFVFHWLNSLLIFSPSFSTATTRFLPVGTSATVETKKRNTNRKNVGQVRSQKQSFKEDLIVGDNGGIISHELA